MKYIMSLLFVVFIFPFIIFADKKQSKKRPDTIFTMTFDYEPIPDFAILNTSFFAKFKVFEEDDLKLFFINRIEYQETEGDLNYFPSKIYSFMSSIRVESPMIFAEIGSAERTDAPFKNSNDFKLFTYTYYNFFPSQTGGFFLGLIYFPLEKVFPDWMWFEKVPFPFFMYQYHDSDLVLNFGLPLMVRWKITEKLLYQVFYIPVYNIRTSLEYNLTKLIMTGLEFVWSQKSVNLSERILPNEKVYFNSKNIGLKIRLFYLLELKAGYCQHRLEIS